MLRIREVGTGSGKRAIQVVLRRYHRTEIIKHLGSGRSPNEIENLKALARQFILEKQGMRPLLPEMIETREEDFLISLKNLSVKGYTHQAAYDYLSLWYEKNGFEAIKSELLKDLVILRIIEPVSKRESLRLLQKYFGRIHSPSTLYKNLPKLSSFRSEAEKAAVSYARQNLDFDFTLVFYDVTTLYFETFRDDALRKKGYSKDGKSAQPQILIGLLVSREGYPIGCQIFPGNKFEGHSLLPVILDLLRTHEIQTLTVVADAAMLSADNLDELKKAGLSYIVGARFKSLSPEVLQEAVTFLDRKEAVFFKKETNLGCLICDFSDSRAAKDKFDRQKQILKAQKAIADPGKYLKRSRFVKETTDSTYALNEELIKRDELTDGIKGYYTNLTTVAEDLIVARYHDLWKIEKAFRIAKSDLLARPIFHHKEESIKTHVLIVFMSLCLSKAIELKTGRSIKSVRDEIWEVLDIQFVDKLTGRRFVKRSGV